ncbi:hypothetical protein N7481_002121 [Penicillium waksmanii]|uniref:uncharacterized protein n=1 Tax=Penicillium waksmanii TaxID=69791 RepID=UPI00254848EA|nr:uncharacterized protein N7481_002121 [Penicillium waksmanii]KAJ5995144.1 hypothetical protein N7481_002121 [Penicillium waksmanii]
MKSGGQNNATISQVINATETCSVIDSNQNSGMLLDSEESSVLNSLHENQTNASTPATSYSMSSFCIVDISSHESEKCLDDFRVFKLQYFPFVHIPIDMTAVQLQKERPFLWLCIVSISTKSTARQKALGYKVRQTVAQIMLLESEKSIDLLLGLLTFLGWGNYHFHGKPFLSVFTHLATSLVFELGLQKPVQAPPPIFNLNACPIASGHRTMEEHRAALGYFLIISVLSSIVPEIEAFRWTPLMEESFRILEEREEVPNDKILVQLVQMQLVLEKNKSRQTSGDSAPGHVDPPEDQVKLFSDMKTKIFDSAPQDDCCFIHFLQLSRNHAISPSQSDRLYIAFTSAQAWLDILFMIPPAEYVGFTFAIFAQISRCLLILYRIATLGSPAWYEDHLLKTTNPLSLLNRIINSLEQVPIIAGLDSHEDLDGDVFSRSAKLLRSFQPEWEAKLGSDHIISDISSMQNVDWMDFSGDFGDDIMYNGWFMDLMSSTF